MITQTSLLVAILTLAVPLFAVSWGSAHLNRKDRGSDAFLDPLLGMVGSGIAVAMCLATLVRTVAPGRLIAAAQGMSGMSLAHESTALIVGAFAVAMTEWTTWIVIVDVRRGRKPRVRLIAVMAALGTTLALCALNTA